MGLSAGFGLQDDRVIRVAGLVDEPGHCLVAFEGFDPLHAVMAIKPLYRLKTVVVAQQLLCIAVPQVALRVVQRPASGQSDQAVGLMLEVGFNLLRESV
ncbi:hypothetical protein GCM10007421_27550 [Halopseudomonas oceani]|nr:hypothetical protein GCM10007421_27550 [Halopseudomonas oceani]